MPSALDEIAGIYAINDISDKNYPALVHDHSLAFFNENALHCIQLERLTRSKYDARMPKFIDSFFKDKTINLNKLKILIHVDNEIGGSFISSSGKFRAETINNKKICVNPTKSKAMWNGQETEAYSVNHELAHICSAIPFYGEIKPNSLLIHFDGGASKSNFSCWLFRDNKLKLIENHYKLKPLTNLFNANALTFALVGGSIKDQNGVPGKFMGLASYGMYNKKIELWLKEHKFFNDIWKSKKVFFDALALFTGKVYKHIDVRESVFQDIAATIHEIFVRDTFKIFRNLATKHRPDYLYYSGGVALNIKLNKLLYESNLFNEIFIPPCPGDSGLALGALAAYTHFNKIKFPKCSPYLNNIGIESYKQFEYTKNDLKEIAGEIAEGKIIGICNGYGEIGPRALGNRSIVARPDSVSLAKKVSIDCKNREWYRPVAPVMLADNFKYFTGKQDIPAAAKYMLYDFVILPEKVNEIEGCVHVDGTSRIQVISTHDENPYLFDLLTLLDKNHQIKALINTSFNIKGEPIVHTHEQALISGKKMQLDYVVLQGRLKKLM